MCMNIEFKRCCSLPMYVLYNNICVWMTTTKNFAIKLSRRTSYVTLSGKCVYCLINFVLLKKMSTKKWMACRNFPHLYLMYFCVLFWNNQKLCKRISILFPNYLVYDRNSVIRSVPKKSLLLYKWWFRQYIFYKNMTILISFD